MKRMQILADKWAIGKPYPCGMSPWLEPEEFTRLVEAALDSLPEELASQMSNVQVVVEDLPDEETSGGHEEGGLLLGLYQGVPLTRRSSSNYFGVLPDRITIYRLNIERICASADEVPDAVRRTVIHEVAHHFGISDPRLDELGWG